MQAASPALEKLLAGQTPHAVLLVGEHTAVRKRPAAQVEQVAQGARPEAL